MGNRVTWNKDFLEIVAEDDPTENDYTPDEVWTLPTLQNRSYLVVTQEAITQSGRMGLRVTQAGALPGSGDTFWALEYLGYQGTLPNPPIWTRIPLDGATLNHLIENPLPLAIYKFRLAAQDPGKAPVYYPELVTPPTPADALYTQLQDMGADGKLTDDEKLVMASWWANAQAEKGDLDAKALATSVSATPYDNAYNALSAKAATTWQASGTIDISGLSPTLYTLWSNYWTERTKLQNAIIYKVSTDLAAVQTAASNAQTTADGKIDCFYQTSAPTTASEGDLWFDTDDGNKIYTRRSGAWVNTQDSQIGSALSAAATAQGTADGKAKIWYQTTAPTGLVAGDQGDMWVDTDDNLKVWAWNGSAWVLAQDWFTANANATAALNYYNTIADDGWLNKGSEKVNLTARFNTATNDKNTLIDKAKALGVGYAELQNAYNTLSGYLNSLSPAWNDVTQDTSINPSATFITNWVNFDTAKTKLLTALQGISRSVDVITTVNQSLPVPSSQVFDGYTLPDSKKVLLANQTTTSQNGIYSLTVSGGYAGGRINPATGATGSTTSTSNGTSTRLFTWASGQALSGTLYLNLTTQSDSTEAPVVAYYSLDGGASWTTWGTYTDPTTTAHTLSVGVSNVLQSNLQIRVTYTGATVRTTEYVPELGHNVTTTEIFYSTVNVTDIYYQATSTAASLLLTKLSTVYDGEVYFCSNGSTYGSKNVALAVNPSTQVITLTATDPPYQAKLPTYTSAPAKVLQNASGVLSWADAAAGGGSGSVTNVSTTAANNGVTATWTNPTTTPALTIGLGNITPTSVSTASAAIAGVSILPFGGGSSSGGSNIVFVASSGSPNSGKMIFGDGSGWNFSFAKKNTGVVTDLITFKDDGSATFTGNVMSGGTLWTRSNSSAGDQYQYNALTMGWNNSTGRGWIQSAGASGVGGLDIQQQGGDTVFGGYVTVPNLYVDASRVTRIVGDTGGNLMFNYNTGVSGNLAWYGGGTLVRFIVDSGGLASGSGFKFNINNPGILNTQYTMSQRDFVNGTLISTSIDYASANSDPFLLEIKGNTYSNLIPCDLKVQGYIYNGTIINIGGISNGLGITGLVAINNGGYLCFWFPRQGYWNGYSVKVTNVGYSGIGAEVNRVTAIVDSVKPTTAKEVAFSSSIIQSLNTGNIGSQTVNYINVSAGNTSGGSYPIVWHSGTNLYSTGGSVWITPSIGRISATSFGGPVYKNEVDTTPAVVMNSDGAYYGEIGRYTTQEWGLGFGNGVGSAMAGYSLVWGTTGVRIKKTLYGDIQQGSYGSISVGGNLNGWAGINFSDYYRTFMVNATMQGFYADNGAWKWRFDDGVLAVGTVPGSSVSGYVANASWATAAGTAGSATQAGILTGPAHTNGSDGWFRSNSATGWFNESYGGGIYMTDSNYVRTYNGVGFYVGGGASILCEGNIGAYYSSDSRLKENVKVIDSPLDKLKAIRGVEFDWTKDAIEAMNGEDGYFVRKHDVGVIAQEIQAILPEIVAEKKDGYLGVKYDRLTALLIEAVKELTAKVERLEAR